MATHNMLNKTATYEKAVEWFKTPPLEYYTLNQVIKN